jgi:hypothetical protein
VGFQDSDVRKRLLRSDFRWQMIMDDLGVLLLCVELIEALGSHCTNTEVWGLEGVAGS